MYCGEKAIVIDCVISNSLESGIKDSNESLEMYYNDTYHFYKHAKEVVNNSPDILEYQKPLVLKISNNRDIKMERVYNKLVRDKIPDIIKKNNEECIITTLNEEEYKKALEDKLVEELNEVLESTGNNRIEELSDMIEVITSLAKLEGKTLNDVIEASSKRKKKEVDLIIRFFLLK